MRDISLPEFSMPDDFINLNDMVKQCMESDEKFESDVFEVKRMEGGKFKRLVDGLIGASWVLQHLSPKIDWFKDQVMEMKDRLSAPMDQHVSRIFILVRISSPSGMNMTRQIL
jgi:hypothetical protein